MASTFAPNKHIEKPAHNDDVDTWDVPVNGNSDIIDTAFGGLITLNATGASGTNVLSSTQYQPRFIVVSGTLTANVTYQFPASVGGQWYVFNNTSGAFSVTFNSAGAGTSTVVAQGKRADLICDATNVLAGSASAGANADITSLSGLTTPLSVAQGGTGAITLTGLAKGAGTAAFVAASVGTDYARPDTASNWTATQTFSGTSATFGESLPNAKELATVSATAATGTITYYVNSQSILYFTTSAAANWTLNLTFSAGTTLNTAMSTGEAASCAFIVSQGATAYYNTTVQVDGTTSGVTTVWLGGAPAAGHASSKDSYTFLVVKTGSAAFTVFASLSAFA